MTLHTRTIMEAIARRLCFRGIYNGTASKLAPHVLYTRSGELYLGAVAVERNGVPPRERKLGIFKVEALSALQLTGEAFRPDTVFDPAEPRFASTTVFSVE